MSLPKDVAVDLWRSDIYVELSRRMRENLLAIERKQMPLELTLRSPMYSDSDRKRLQNTFTSTGEPTKPPVYLSPFQDDVNRLVHSPAFRRLQGKTQLFPESESSFFRNRLTHSLEVANIAKIIASKLNREEEFLNGCCSTPGDMQIDLDLVEFGALAHDLGHPPFGHTGEQVLDAKMREYGGFEGNAQSFRIISIIEKREYRDKSQAFFSQEGKDERVGLNITFRGLASVLKYDREIYGGRSASDSLQKGYYKSDAELVARTKQKVTGNGVPTQKPFKTVECSIMDLGDDIAYSTYDLEDALESGFVGLGDLWYPDSAVLDATKKSLKNLKIDEADVLPTLHEFVNSATKWYKPSTNSPNPAAEDHFQSVVVFNELGRDGYVRTQFMSGWVEYLINGISLVPDYDMPALSSVKIDQERERSILVLKHFIFYALTMSPRLQHADFRGRYMLDEIFEALSKPKWANKLLPRDITKTWAPLGSEVNDDLRMRLVCDYIAGMTNRDACRLYGRLYSENDQSIYGPES